MRELGFGIYVDENQPLDAPLSPREVLAAKQRETATLDPAQAATWETRAPSFLHSGALSTSRTGLLPIREFSREKLEDKDIHQSRKVSDTENDHPDSKDFLDLINESLVIQKRRGSKLDGKARRVRERTASSDYPAEGQQSPPQRAIASPACGGSLNLKELSKYGSATYDLSEIRSRTPSSSKTKASDDHNSRHEAIADAEAAVTEWRGESKHARGRTSSYGQYELADSCEVLPLDSLSQQGRSTEDLAAVTPGPKFPVAKRARKTSEVTFKNTPQVEMHHHGPTDQYHTESPDPTKEPPRHAARLGNGKRTASHFSLRSLSESLSKRPRLGVKKLANTFYNGGKRVLAHVRQNFKHSNSKGRRGFAAKRAKGMQEGQRQHLPQANPEKDPAGVASDLECRKSEEWWTAGAKRYHAPAWMKFGHP